MQAMRKRTAKVSGPEPPKAKSAGGGTKAKEPPRQRAVQTGWGWKRLLVCSVLLPILCGSCIYVYNRLRNPQFETEFVLGAVTDRTARVWVYAAHHAHVVVRYRPATTAAEWSESAPQRVDKATQRHWTLVVDLGGLAPNTVYDYQVLFFRAETGSPSSMSEVQRLRTYAPSGAPTRFSFVYGSCIETGFPWPFDSLDVLSTWRRLYDPLFALILGDLVYADLPFPVPFERAYRKLFDDPHYARFFKDASRYVIYDDHEVANNWDRGSELPLFREAMEAYDAFIGSANPEPPRLHQQQQPQQQKQRLLDTPLDQRRRYYNFTVGNVGFFVLDERPYRSGNHEPDGPNKTLLGAEQKACLKQWLLETNTTLTFRFIASPGMFASVGGPADGWAYFEHEREELFDYMEEHHMRGVVLLSGDVHWAGAFEHRRGLFEFATSPIHTFPLFPSVRASAPQTEGGEHEPRPMVLFTHTWTFHFSVVEIDTEAERPFLRHTTYAYLLDATQPFPVHQLQLFLDDVQLASTR